MSYIQTCFTFSSDITRELELIELISIAVLVTCYFPDESDSSEKDNCNTISNCFKNH